MSACVNAWGSATPADGDEEAEGEEEAGDEEEAEGEGEGDFDGLADFVGDADGVGANADTWPRVGAVAGLCDRELRGLGLADAPLVAAGVTVGAAAVLCVWARARTPCTPESVISVALIAATIHTVTAATAVAVPGLARILLHERNDLARWDPIAPGSTAGIRFNDSNGLRGSSRLHGSHRLRGSRRLAAAAGSAAEPDQRQ